MTTLFTIIFISKPLTIECPHFGCIIFIYNWCTCNLTQIIHCRVRGIDSDYWGAYIKKKQREDAAHLKRPHLKRKNRAQLSYNLALFTMGSEYLGNNFPAVPLSREKTFSCPGVPLAWAKIPGQLLFPGTTKWMSIYLIALKFFRRNDQNSCFRPSFFCFRISFLILERPFMF